MIEYITDQSTLPIGSLFWTLLPVDFGPIQLDRVFPNWRLILVRGCPMRVRGQHDHGAPVEHLYIDTGTLVKLRRLAAASGSTAPSPIPRCRRDDGGCPHETPASRLPRHDPDDHVAVWPEIDGGVDADHRGVVGVLTAPAQDAHARATDSHVKPERPCSRSIHDGKPRPSGPGAALLVGVEDALDGDDVGGRPEVRQVVFLVGVDEALERLDDVAL